MNHLDLNCQMDESAVRKRGVTFEVSEGKIPDYTPHINGVDEVFQPAGSHFIDDLDFLENCGGNNDDAMEQLQRKSLYVKFDPLCTSPGFDPLPKLSEDGQVPPADHSDTLIHLSASTPGKIDIESLSLRDTNHFNGSDTFTLQDIDNINIPDLINGDLVEPLLYTQSDMDDSIRKVASDFDEEMKAREVDLQKKYVELQGNLQEEVAMRELMGKDSQDKIDCLRRETLDMKQVLSQYEITIVELTENSHFDKRLNEDSVAESIRAKDGLQEDLNTAEQSLFDAYKRIEKLKQTVETLKHNEESLKKNSDELTAKIEKSEDRYDRLKTHAGESIECANTVIAKVRKQQEIDIAGLQAALKLAQSRVNNLELEIQQKNVENEQLTQICDDLIKKVSGN